MTQPISNIWVCATWVSGLWKWPCLLHNKLSLLEKPLELERMGHTLTGWWGKLFKTFGLEQWSLLKGPVHSAFCFHPKSFPKCLQIMPQALAGRGVATLLDSLVVWGLVIANRCPSTFWVFVTLTFWGLPTDGVMHDGLGEQGTGRNSLQVKSGTERLFSMKEINFGMC